MKKIKVPLTANEMLERINSPWASVRDIMDIGFIGQTKATYIMNDIKASLESQGYKLPSYVIPMEKVVEYFKINISYLKKVSK